MGARIPGTPGERLKDTIKRNGLTCKQFSKSVGCYNTTLSRYINGKLEMPEDFIRRASEALGVTDKYLMTGDLEDVELKEYGTKNDRQYSEITKRLDALEKTMKRIESLLQIQFMENSVIMLEEHQKMIENYKEEIMADRGDLINQLAASMGAGDFASTKYEDSRYDPKTGTLYCEGIMITKPIIEKAEAHFKSLKAKCNYNDSASREMAMIYQVAIEGIKRFKAEGQETIKEDRS